MGPGILNSWFFACKVPDTSHEAVVRIKYSSTQEALRVVPSALLGLAGIDFGLDVVVIAILGSEFCPLSHIQQCETYAFLAQT